MAFTGNSGLPLEHHHIATSHGTLHISSLRPNSPDTSTPSPLTLLHVHSNSSCTLSFHRLLTHLHTHSFPLTSHRTLLLDLPGHGASTNAPNPSASYTQPSHATAALEALHALVHPATANGKWRWRRRRARVEPGRARSAGGRRAKPETETSTHNRNHDSAASQERDGKGGDEEKGGEREEEEDEDEEEEENDDDHMALAEQEIWPPAAFDTLPSPTEPSAAHTSAVSATEPRTPTDEPDASCSTRSKAGAESTSGCSARRAKSPSAS
ncbi:hypothetical protein IWZ03DRAFT_431575 [Phyllosticta citriasiana]|uniref:Uncharacterized protein n=1 Tax=Phyllosticta citriasiana TaxID=595635 RepID=A0ABR1KFV2_9PEZI